MTEEKTEETQSIFISPPGHFKILPKLPLCPNNIKYRQHSELEGHQLQCHFAQEETKAQKD